MDDLGGHIVAQLVAAAPSHPHQTAGIDPGQPFGKDLTSGIDDLNRVISLELPLDSDDTRREKGATLLHQRPPCPSIDDDGSLRADGEGDPQLAGRKATITGVNHRPHTRLTSHGIPQHMLAVGRGDDGTHSRPGSDPCGRHLGGHPAASARRP